MAQLAGAKFWMLYPPDRPRPPEHMYSRMMLSHPSKFLAELGATPAAERPVVCLQRAGEVLWLPNFWLHATMNVGHSIALGAQTHFNLGRLATGGPDVHAAFQGELERAASSYFTRSILLSKEMDEMHRAAMRGTGLPREQQDHKLLDGFQKVVDASPLHIGSVTNVLSGAGQMGASGAEKAVGTLRDTVEAVHRQAQSGHISPRAAARCLALLAWSSGAMAEAHHAGFGAAVRLAIAHALALVPDETLALEARRRLDARRRG